MIWIQHRDRHHVFMIRPGNEGKCMAKRMIYQGRTALVALSVLLLLCFALAASLALYPSADGSQVMADQGATMDMSNLDQGYFMLKHSPTSKRLKMRIIRGSEFYTYDLDAEDRYETFALPFGSGSYEVQIYKQVSGKKYSNAASFAFSASIADSTLPYLYPNQYISYTAGSQAVLTSAALCAGLSSTQEKLDAIRAYIVENITYDFDLASSVQSGYLPSVDHVLDVGKGICFDYAALAACMLRSQGIPTKLEIGYADTVYHAWNSVLINGDWQRLDTTAEANDMVVSRYTIERTY